MEKEDSWVCSQCGKPTNEPEKVCVICRTENTSIKANVSKKSWEKKG